MSAAQSSLDAALPAVAAGNIGAIWEAALDSSEAAALVIDTTENRIVQFNRAALELTGLPGLEMAQSRASDLFPRQLATLTNFTLECQDKGPAWSSALAIRCIHDGPRAIEVFGSAWTRAGRRFLMLIAFDHKRQQVRRAKVAIARMHGLDAPPGQRFDTVFRELERGNQLILQAAGEGIYGVDANGRFTFMNPAAERMLGFTAEEVIGRNGHTLIHHSHANGDPYPHKACPIYAAFKDRTIYRVDNEVFWRKDGTSFPVEYTSTPITEQGRALGAVIVFRDVSAQRKARQDLEAALAEVRKLQHRLELENAYLQDELAAEGQHHEIVGASSAVRHILRQIELVAPTDATVLVSGESGTGKELIARAIHQASARSGRPLIRVNCAAIPRELFESEFFGHAKGAFTGAIAERVGRFELANGGTIFLDEVGEIPLELQSKLLRVLQEQQFERVGETRTRETDVRVIAATNRDLQLEVQGRRFREDLYFRLNVFPIVSPPLRERLEDIGLLAAQFVRRACARAHRPELPISLADVERLKAYNWPGNIRELENIIERAVIVSNDSRLRLDVPGPVPVPRAAIGGPDTAHNAPGETIGSGRILREADRQGRDRENILRALEHCDGRVSGDRGAAALLGLPATTLYSRIARLNIDTRAIRRRSRDTK
ncbi:MAG: sigma 54-interacting transcriptional regulator [Burkholderiaceae bacterium]